MTAADRTFQIFAKPVGARCNLNCSYCYYLPVLERFEDRPIATMKDALLETYIRQHIEAATDPVIQFSWHGGEPTLLGVERFRRIVDWQERYCPPGREIVNGMQTNGLLLDDQWYRFLAEHRFRVGISIDGPSHLHDLHRVTPHGAATHEQAARAVERLLADGVHVELLCVVHADNVLYPLEVYGYLRRLGASFLTFLPLVEARAGGTVSERSVTARLWGEFLCAVFDEWQGADIGRVKVQIFEEAARTAFGLEHSLCIFRRRCGGVPVLEANGDVYACDHFVNDAHLLGNIGTDSLADMLDGERLHTFGAAKQHTLPRQCRDCEVLDMCNGGCPRNRFTETRDGEPGLNYLCPGYLRFFTYCRPFVSAIARVWAGSGAISDP